MSAGVTSGFESRMKALTDRRSELTKLRKSTAYKLHENSEHWDTTAAVAYDFGVDLEI